MSNNVVDEEIVVIEDFVVHFVGIQNNVDDIDKNEIVNEKLHFEKETVKNVVDNEKVIQDEKIDEVFVFRKV